MMFGVNVGPTLGQPVVTPEIRPMKGLKEEREGRM